MTTGRDWQTSTKRWVRPSRMTTGTVRSTNVSTGGVLKPVLRYAPTYQLDPFRPLNRENCELIMKTVVDAALDGFRYAPKQAQNLCKQVSEEIKTRIKLMNFDRYKLICIVTIGEHFLQDYRSVANFLWDAEKDGFITYSYDTPYFFAIATLYYTYYD